MCSVFDCSYRKVESVALRNFDIQQWNQLGRKNDVPASSPRIAELPVTPAGLQLLAFLLR